MTRVLAFLTGVCFLLFSCHNVAKKAEDVASTATTEVGKAVGKTSTEFVNGVKEGVDNAYGCTLVLAPRLRSQGMETGKFVITKDSSENRNRLSVYFIFNKLFQSFFVSVSLLNDPAIMFLHDILSSFL